MAQERIVKKIKITPKDYDDMVKQIVEEGKDDAYVIKEAMRAASTTLTPAELLNLEPDARKRMEERVRQINALRQGKINIFPK